MRTHWLTCLALLAVAACAGDRVHSSSRQEDFRRDYSGGMLCTSAPCTVKITVAAGCNATVDPPTLGVDTSLDDVTIRWEIQSESFGRVAFVAAPADGINPKPPPGPWNAEFKRPDRASDTVFTWLDKNKVEGGHPGRRHDYNIDMTQEGAPCHVDPIIINDY